MRHFALLSRTGLIVAGAALLVATGGCSRIRDHKGYVLDSTLVDAIQPGIDNRDSVTKTLGRPSFSAQFGEDVWYYVSRDTRAYAFAKPNPSAQVVMAIRFDPAGNVARVDKTGVEQVASISPSGDKTPTLGRSRGFLSELFGNIGQVGSVGRSGGTVDNPN